MPHFLEHLRITPVKRHLSQLRQSTHCPPLSCTPRPLPHSSRAAPSVPASCPGRNGRLEALRVHESSVAGSVCRTRDVSNREFQRVRKCESLTMTGALSRNMDRHPLSTNLSQKLQRKQFMPSSISHSLPRGASVCSVGVVRLVHCCQLNLSGVCSLTEKYCSTSSDPHPESRRQGNHRHDTPSPDRLGKHPKPSKSWLLSSSVEVLANR